MSVSLSLVTAVTPLLCRKVILNVIVLTVFLCRFTATSDAQITPQDDDLFVDPVESDAIEKTEASTAEPSNVVAARVVGQRPFRLLYEDRSPKIVCEVTLYSDNRQVLHGPYAEYYRNGKQFSRGQYRNARRHGEWTFWHANGTVAKQGEYVEDKPTGTWSVTRSDGQTARQESYQDGLPHGVWVTYAKDGTTPVSRIEFNEGKPVKSPTSP